MVDQKIVQMWMDRTVYDMDTARAMLQTGEEVVQDFVQFSEETIAWLYQKMK